MKDDAPPRFSLASRSEKFEELVAKERDLTNFMDSFPSRRAAKLEEMRAKQDAIVALLDRISKLQVRAAHAARAKEWVQLGCAVAVP